MTTSRELADRFWRALFTPGGWRKIAADPELMAWLRRIGVLDSERPRKDRTMGHRWE